MMVLLDTCAVVCLAAEPARFTEQARQAVTAPETIVYCSAITAAALS